MVAVFGIGVDKITPSKDNSAFDPGTDYDKWYFTQSILYIMQ